MTQEIKVTNLLLASLLECGGASVNTIDPSRRFSTVTLDLTHFSREQLVDKLNRLVRVIERAEDPAEFTQLFSASMLGEMEDKYVRLKRRVVSAREDKSGQ
ncbi:MAG: hypothetical protein ACO32I_01280 [Candidatus Limnocylindrus sp.]|jgi:hypothetical protein